MSSPSNKIFLEATRLFAKYIYNLEINAMSGISNSGNVMFMEELESVVEVGSIFRLRTWWLFSQDPKILWDSDPIVKKCILDYLKKFRPELFGYRRLREQYRQINDPWEPTVKE